MSNQKLINQELKFPSIDDIKKLQAAMIPISCDPPEPVHYFAPGTYTRELTIPKGMLVVGKTHRHEHVLMVLKGKAIVISESGRSTVESGHVSISPAGVKRVVLALEDVTFVTVHKNSDDETDLEAIEKEHILPEEFNIENLTGKIEVDL